MAVEPGDPWRKATDAGRIASFLRGCERELEPGDRDALADALAEHETSVRAGWPGEPPELDGFWAELARCTPSQDSLSAGVRRVNAVDLHLAYTARIGHADAIAALDRSCIADIRALIRHVDPSDAFADDVCQRVRTKLLVPEHGAPARLAYYRGEGRLRTWIGVVAVREAVDLARQQQRRSAREAATELLATADDGSPDLALLRREYEDAFRGAFAAALAELAPDERNLLRLHFVHGSTLDELARMHAVHRSTIARWIARLREQLFERTRGRLELQTREFADALELIRSRLDLRLSSTLREGG